VVDVFKAVEQRPTDIRRDVRRKGLRLADLEKFIRRMLPALVRWSDQNDFGPLIIPQDGRDLLAAQKFH
jgi:hypothetical protein